MTKKYYSEQTKFIHKAAQGFFESGLITKNKMKEFDQGCIVREKNKSKIKPKKKQA